MGQGARASAQQRVSSTARSQGHSRGGGRGPCAPWQQCCPRRRNLSSPSCAHALPFEPQPPCCPSLPPPGPQVGTLESGEIDYDELRQHLAANAARPAIINVNIGTTVKGAVDDLDRVLDILRVRSEGG